MKDECFDFTIPIVASKHHNAPSCCHGCIFCQHFIFISLNLPFSFHLPSFFVSGFASPCPSASSLSTGGGFGPVAGRLTDLQVLLTSRLRRANAGGHRLPVSTLPAERLPPLIGEARQEGVPINNL